jgi:hypothetical protein
VVRVALEEDLGGAGDASALVGAERRQRLLHGRPGLDLDEGDAAASPDDQVDFAHRRAEAPGEHPVAAPAPAAGGPGGRHGRTPLA